ncbi:MAG TPA: hypothetical protein VLE47_02400 [Candidatus Saccharimonadales bacterium]|nr:hypothetical protein [Candidatus Saccharimonadales bacterium]
MRVVFLGFSLVGLLIIVVIVALLATNNFQSLGFVGSKNNSSTNPINSAKSVKAKADLNTLGVRLNLYYSQNGSYPSSLSEIDVSGITLADFNYSLCSSMKAVVTDTGEVMVFENGSGNFSDQASC